MSIIKLQEEEITKLKDIQSKNNEIVFNLGILDLDINALEISIESLKERRKNLRNDFENLSKEQKVNAEDLTEKYGDGNIDLETGEFTAVE